MRCSKCPDPAWVELKRHHSAYCAPHYVEFFDRQVERTIKHFHMFGKEDKILVAVSGGKDSLALWHVLHRMGYSTAGLYIDLGITEYSTRSKEKSIAFAALHGLRLIVKDVRSEYGDGLLGIPELSRALKRVPCSGCGLTTRYVLNQVAHEEGFSVLATGHNLDDEAATLMGNVLHWQMQYLARQSPMLEATHPGLSRKVKPLCGFTERETLSYTLIQEIDFIEEECPHSHGAHSLLYKDVLNRIEQESPGSKQAFMQGFLDRAKPLVQASDDPTLNNCTRCGEPTTGDDLCSFCRTWDRAKSVWSRRQRPIAAGVAQPAPANVILSAAEDLPPLPPSSGED